MLRGYPTDDELRRTFDDVLDLVRHGGGVHSCSGLDLRTQDGLWEIADAYPDISDELVAAAHAAFAGQLDGSNSAARAAALAREFEKRRAGP